jgi:hypothetical protein
MIGRRPAATPGERALRPGGPVAVRRQGLHTIRPALRTTRNLPPRTARRAPGAFAFAVLAIAVPLVGCGAGPSSSGAGPGAASQTHRPPTPVPTTPASGTPKSPPASAVGQTKTDWGRIWDEVPASFPTYPGAEPTEPAEGPASASLALPAGSADAADWYANALRVLGYRVDESSPLEDGSSTIDATGRPPDCHVRITVTPRGTVLFATILYGASCRFV